MAQKAEDHGLQVGEDRDVLASSVPGGRCGCTGVFYPWRKTDRTGSFLSDVFQKDETKAEILDSFIKQYYAGTPFIPGELMLQEELEDSRRYWRNG